MSRGFPHHLLSKLIIFRTEKLAMLAMNFNKLIIGVGGIGVLGFSVIMVLTNPKPRDYEDYATEELTSYLKENVCTQVSRPLQGLLENYCKSLVDTGKPHIHQLISQQTTRHNFLLFSIYQTQLSLPFPIPGYEFQTLGIFQQFYTYQAEQI